MSAAAAVTAEQLVAFVDGELPEPRLGLVAAALASDPATRAMAVALRRGGGAAARAYDAVLAEPIPPRLLALLGEAPAAPRAVRVRPRWRRHPLPALAAAASIAALLLGLAGGYVLRGPQAPLRPASDGDDPAADRFAAALYQALLRDRIGASIDYAVPGRGITGRVTVTAALQTPGGLSCREFRHETRRGSAAESEAGVACRTPDGGWQTLTLPAP
jgi:hypothetical protein